MNIAIGDLLRELIDAYKDYVIGNQTKGTPTLSE